MTPEHKAAVEIMVECGMSTRAIVRDAGWPEGEAPRVRDVAKMVRRFQRPPTCVINGQVHRVLRLEGVKKTFKQWSAETGISSKLISARILRGWSERRTLTEKPNRRQNNMALALKRDSNEPEIINALTRAGCSVCILNGKGLPDLLVGRAGRNYLLEVKDPLKGDLTDAQVYWHGQWRGKVHVVHTVAEAMKAVELLR